MRFDHDRLRRRAVPRPVDRIGGNPVEIPFLSMKSLVLDKKPNFPLQDVIDLLRYVDMRSRVVTRRSYGHHEAGFVPIGLSCHHGALTFTLLQHYFPCRNVLSLYMKRHRPLLFSRMLSPSDLAASSRNGVLSLCPRRILETGVPSCLVFLSGIIFNVFTLPELSRRGPGDPLFRNLPISVTGSRTPLTPWVPPEVVAGFRLVS